jgi:hypothetical protein
MPNPSSGIFTITFTENIQQVEVLDITGKVIKKVEVKSNTSSLSLDISDLAGGIYFARITSPKGVFIKKLVKQ